MKNFISSKHFCRIYNNANEIERKNMLENLLKSEYIPLGLEEFLKGIYHNLSKDMFELMYKLEDKLEEQNTFIGKSPRFVGVGRDWSAEPIWHDGANCDCGECLLLPTQLQKYL